MEIGVPFYGNSAQEAAGPDATAFSGGARFRDGAGVREERFFDVLRTPCRRHFPSEEADLLPLTAIFSPVASPSHDSRPDSHELTPVLRSDWVRDGYQSAAKRRDCRIREGYHPGLAFKSRANARPAGDGRLGS